MFYYLLYVKKTFPPLSKESLLDFWRECFLFNFKHDLNVNRVDAHLVQEIVNLFLIFRGVIGNLSFIITRTIFENIFIFSLVVGRNLQATIEAKLARAGIASLEHLRLNLNSLYLVMHNSWCDG